MFDKQAKKLNGFDIGLIKLSVASITLAAISYIPSLMNWVHGTNKLYFLLAAIIFGARPLYKAYIE